MIFVNIFVVSQPGPCSLGFESVYFSELALIKLESLYFCIRSTAVLINQNFISLARENAVILQSYDIYDLRIYYLARGED